jgi:hypothetical protein
MKSRRGNLAQKFRRQFPRDKLIRRENSFHKNATLSPAVAVNGCSDPSRPFLAVVGPNFQIRIFLFSVQQPITMHARSLRPKAKSASKAPGAVAIIRVVSEVFWAWRDFAQPAVYPGRSLYRQSSISTGSDRSQRLLAANRSRI